MDDVDPKIDRLFRSAAQAGEDDSPAAPFGFDTRVVALWRAAKPRNGNGLALFVRRVAMTALSVIVIASAAVLYEVNQDSDADDLSANEYAIADSAIQNEF
jgi:hypothetical protein